MHLIPTRDPKPAHYHFDIRFLVQASSTKFRVDDKSHALAWAPADRVDAFTCQESNVPIARKCLTRTTGRDLTGPAVRDRPAQNPLRSPRAATKRSTSASQGRNAPLALQPNRTDL